jgi:lipopolysaccharide transport system ATP-binding protein
MSESAIAVENLSKSYLVGHKLDRPKQYGHTTLRDVITRQARNFVRNAVDVLRGRQVVQGDEVEEFWALKNVNFEIKQGEAVGIIGRNGAGKSTLLKILSRITEPTMGRVKLQGRVASLLEVGTGFHQELTGRENIFLNGAILGMKQTEIRKKFDEIVAFAGVEKFLDTPVKRYSSGMYVRLAFAVAAHLEPEILIVDEVLAVGDVEFQKKCLGKMSDVSRQGRTVLFVSHNLDAVRKLCRSAIIIQDGQLAFNGSVENAIELYLSPLVGPVAARSFERPKGLGNTPFFQSACILNHHGERSSNIDVRRGFSVELTYEIPKSVRNLEVAIRVLTNDARPVFTSIMSEAMPEMLHQPQQGVWTAIATIPGNFLMPGDYLINIALHESVGQLFDLHEGIFRISIEDTGTIFTKYNHNHMIGVVMRPLVWTRAPSADMTQAVITNEK